MKQENDSYSEDYILLHPLRRKIIEQLQTGEAYIKNIARKLDMANKDRLIGFHLKVLEEHGFVTGRYDLENPTPIPTIVKYYSLTSKTHETLQNLATKLQENITK